MTQRIRQQLVPLQSLQQGYVRLDLRQATDFAWDTVYFFNGEEGGAYANSKMGTQWDEPLVPNLFKRLVFVHQQTVVAFADFNEEASVLGTSPDNFPLPFYLYLCPGPGKGVARAAAQFAVFRECENGHRSYPMVPLGCFAQYDFTTKPCGNPSGAVPIAQ